MNLLHNADNTFIEAKAYKLLTCPTFLLLGQAGVTLSDITTLICDVMENKSTKFTQIQDEFEFKITLQ